MAEQEFSMSERTWQIHGLFKHAIAVLDIESQWPLRTDPRVGLSRGEIVLSPILAREVEHASGGVSPSLANEEAQGRPMRVSQTR